MRIIKIPSPFNKNKYDNIFFINFIKTNISKYQIDIKYLLNFISKIEEDDNIKPILYILYQILLTNDLSPIGLNPKPSNGIELKNPTNNKPFGIYHLHLNEQYVFIWYASWDKNGIFLNFRYIKHPLGNDNYETIIKEIYKNSNGYNFELENYFNDLLMILNFNINEVLRFKEFINKK